MSKKKVTGLSFAVLGIVFVVYNLLVFMILKPQTASFWLSYGFMVLAFGLQVLGMYLSFKDFTVQAVFFGIPLSQFTLFYFFAELFMSTVFMIFQQISWKVPFLLQIILLAIYAIVAIVSVATRDAAVASKDHYQQSAASMRMNTVDVETLRDQATDPELKEQLRRLAETVRYSDPMTNEAVADVEARIYQMMQDLVYCCDDGDIYGAREACTKLQRLYVERNRKLQASK